MKQKYLIPYLLLDKGYGLFFGAGITFLFWDFIPMKLLGLLILYTVFDLIGYENLPQQDKVDAANGDGRKTVASFRILQHAFLALLTAFLWAWQGMPLAAAFIILWWTGSADILYHVIGQYEMWKYRYWISWTPLGLILKLITGENTVAPIPTFIQVLAGWLIVLILIL